MSDTPTRPQADSLRVGTTPDTASSPLVREFYAFWRTRCRDGRLPAKADLDPVDMRAFLANILLLEVLHDPLDFRYRIIGERIVERLGNMTGQTVGATALASVSNSAFRNYAAVAETGQPQFLEGRTMTAFRSDMPCVLSRVHCPLAADGRTVDHIISCVTFSDLA